MLFCVKRRSSGLNVYITKRGAPATAGNLAPSSAFKTQAGASTAWPLASTEKRTVISTSACLKHFLSAGRRGAMAESIREAAGAEAMRAVNNKTVISGAALTQLDQTCQSKTDP